jgi:hypothetical protein
MMSHVVMLGKCLKVSVKEGMEVRRRDTLMFEAEAGEAMKSKLDCSECGCGAKLWLR